MNSEQLDEIEQRYSQVSETRQDFYDLMMLARNALKLESKLEKYEKALKKIIQHAEMEDDLDPHPLTLRDLAREALKEESEK